jgi:glycosyl transferase family 25
MHKIMWEFVDHVVYINLDRRTDRDTRVREVLAQFANKVIRLSAIERTPGFIGCLESHIAVLNAAKHYKWRNVLVVEDDVEWNEFDTAYPIVEKLASQPYNVIHFGPSVPLINKETYELYDGQTTSSYLVNGHYIDTLLTCYKEALPNLVQTHNESLYGSDQCWKKLMKQGGWFAPNPALMYQAPGHSDIRNRFQDHREYWNLSLATAWKPVLTVHVMGGLGNQLFQLAALTHVANATKRTPYIQTLVNPSTHTEACYFDSIFSSFKGLYSNTHPLVRLNEPSLSYTNWSSVIQTHPNVELHGYFQDWRYVDRDFVEKLTFPDVSSKYPGIKNGIFLHIRGGDYVGNAFHDIGLDAYYERALTYFPDAHVYIVTNDVDYAMKRPFIQGLNYTLVTESEIETLFLMSQCAGGICANSSFSWWGAFLNPNRKIVMPDRWYADPNLSTVGYYFPGVIKCQV